MLLNRSVSTIQTAASFFDDRWTNWEPLPHQELFMAKLQAIVHRRSAICVYGDYDVDGVTSTAMMVALLRQAGCTVDYIAPHRLNDGYGLNMDRIHGIAHRQYDAFITLDCGISNVEEIRALKDQSPHTQVLIVDHHQCPTTLPPADAIVDNFIKKVNLRMGEIPKSVKKKLNPLK